MKTKNYILILTAVIFSAITLTASRCSKEQEPKPEVNNENKIVIEVCGSTSPDWLISEINSIIEPVQPNLRPVSVYSTVLSDVTYILVTDMVNNAMVYQLRFFLCSGESVSYETAEYSVLKQMYYENRENFTLLWSNSNP